MARSPATRAGRGADSDDTAGTPAQVTSGAVAAADSALPLPPWVDSALVGLLAQRATLPHALLITGPTGIGKSLLAMRLAAALLCESPDAQGRACNRCSACGWFAQGNHPDFRKLEPIDEEAAERAGKGVKASKAIRIAQVRAISQFIALATHRGGRRIVVVDPADALNAESANALLKTLEEPTAATHFLIVGDRWQGLPATIVSRCVRTTLAMPARDAALAWLTAQPGVDAAIAADALDAADGAPLRARALADAGHAAARRAIVEAIASLPETGSATVIESLANRPAIEWIDVLQGWVADLGRVLLGAAPRRFGAHRQRLERLVRRIDQARLGQFSQWLDQQRAVADHPLNARLFCEGAIMSYLAIFRL